MGNPFMPFGKTAEKRDGNLLPANGLELRLLKCIFIVKKKVVIYNSDSHRQST